MTNITARMYKDGTVFEVLPDGSERPFPKQQMRQMTEEEIYAAALSDPDAQPLTEADVARLKRVSRAKNIRLRADQIPDNFCEVGDLITVGLRLRYTQPTFLTNRNNYTCTLICKPIHCTDCITPRFHSGKSCTFT